MGEVMGRVVFLVDMNAFFISCEMAKNPELKGKPAAVAGDPKDRAGIVLTANYEARKYGVKTTMTIRQAKELCPDIIFVPPTHGLYEKKSAEVMDILRRYSPVIQQNSIDEAWMDLTGCEALFGEPFKIAQCIMKDIMDELDLWCSIGISENKFLAKMASEMKKPLGITEVWEKDVKSKIWPLPVRSMYGIGKQTEKKLSGLAIYKIGDIAAFDKPLLVKTFGKYGEELYRLSNGIDLSPVEENPHHDSKSISRSTTLSEDTTDLEYSKIILLNLAEEIGMDARRSNLKGRTVSITLKYWDFTSITRQKSITPTYLTKNIYETGARLLDVNWSKTRPVRLIGIALSDVEVENMEQLSLFNFASHTGHLCNDNTSKKQERLEKAMDHIREKFGTDKIKRAKTINSYKKR